jgi:hypothetical protein
MGNVRIVGVAPEASFTLTLIRVTTIFRHANASGTRRILSTIQTTALHTLLTSNGRISTSLSDQSRPPHPSPFTYFVANLLQLSSPEAMENSTFYAAGGALMAVLAGFLLLRPTGLVKWLQRKNYQYEVTFALYMLTPTEKFVFST